MRKLCVITEKFLYGGLEKNISDFTNMSLKKGYDIILITSQIPTDVKRILEQKKIKVYKVDMPEETNYTKLIDNVFKIGSILKKEQCDAVILHPFTSLIYGYLAVILVDLPFFVILHGPLSITFSIPPIYTYKFILQDILKNAAKVYCVSEDLVNLLKEMFPDLNNLGLFPNALPEEYFTNIPFSPKGDIILVTTFQNVKLRGILEFLNLFKSLPEKYKRKVNVFGEGEAFESIKDWIKKSNLERYFHFYGYVDNYANVINGEISFGVAMARSAIEILSLNIPLCVLGLDGPKGFVNKNNFKDFLFSNFAGFHLPNVSVDEFIKQFNDVITNPEKYRLANMVKQQLSLEKYFEKFEEDLEYVLNNFSGYSDTEKFKVYKLLLSYLPAKSFRDLNFIYNMLFFSKVDSHDELINLNEITKQVNYYEHLAKNLEEENKNLKEQVKIKEHELLKIKEENELLKKQLRLLEEKVNLLISEINTYKTQLNKIYMSRFWKLASRYYKLKGIIKGIPQTLIKHRALKQIKKNIESYQLKGRTTFIYPPTIDWNVPLFQRPQHLSLQLSNKGHLVLFFTPNYKDKVIGLKKVKDGLILSPLFKEFLKSLENYKSMWMFLPSTNNEIPIWEVRKLKAKGMKIIYDYIDEIHPDISAETHISWKNFIELKNDDVDLITCVSKKLYQEMLERFPEEKVVYLPNGVEYEHFKVNKDLDKINDYMKSIVLQGKPIIGYYGALANWIDYELLICAALNHPDWNFVLIGVDYEGSLQKYLHKFPSNIYFLGHIPYKELPWYAIWFDVALIPFKKGEIAQATSPIKMYEYMALNKPIVATEDLIECYGYKGVFISKNECDDFSEKIQQALEVKDSEEIIKELDKIAKENTWEKRVERLLEYIKRYE